MFTIPTAIFSSSADLTNLNDEDFVDWGHEETYKTAIGVGECASVIIDLVATLLYESEEKFGWANDAFNESRWADSIYYTYTTLIGAAKAMLLDKGVNSSTQTGVIKEFDARYVATGEFTLPNTFDELVLQINKNEPSEAFAAAYMQEAKEFLEQAKLKREELVKA